MADSFKDGVLQAYTDLKLDKDVMKNEPDTIPEIEDKDYYDPEPFF